MNFFQHQDAARKKTGRLVLLFVLAVAAIIAGVYLIVAFAYAAGNTPQGHEINPADLWNPQLFAVTALAVTAIIAAGSFYQIASLGTGGKVIAEMLGGRLVSSNTTDCGPSITSAVTSSPRCAGRQCMNTASAFAADINASFT